MSFFILDIFCFPGTGVVTTPEGSKLIRDVQVGDTVRVVSKTGQVEWSQVCGWGHNEPSRVAPFLQITTQQHRITISQEHLISVVRNGGFEYVQAGKILKGMSILTCDPQLTGTHAEVVQSIEFVQQTGVFAPFTMTGTIIVDGVVASCYADVKSHSVAHAAMKPMRTMFKRHPEKAQAHHQTSKHITGSHRWPDLMARATLRA